jgi:hypothetical protein
MSREPLSTPNRYSLAAEPHVGLWGVGFLPRRCQKVYVKSRTGHDYETTNLLGVGRMKKLLRENTNFQAEVVAPTIPENNIARFPPRRVMLARLYNRLVTMRGLRFAFLHFGSLFPGGRQKEALSARRGMR